MSKNGAEPPTNSSDPSVLIVTPSLNQAQYIRFTLQSVLSQMGSKDTYVVVDGGSSDGTLDVLAEYQDPRLHTFCHAGQSQAAALAFAFSNFSADICCYINTDDFFLTGALQFAKTAFLENPHIDAIYGNRIFINPSNKATGVWSLPTHSNYLMRRWDYIPQESAFWTYDSMIQVGGFNADLEFAVDYDFFVRLMKSHRLAHHSEYLSTFRVHDTSKTSTINDSIGKREVAHIQSQNSISLHPWDRAIGRALRHWIEFSSKRALKGRSAKIQKEINHSIIQTKATPTSIARVNLD